MILFAVFLLLSFQATGKVAGASWTNLQNELAEEQALVMSFNQTMTEADRSLLSELLDSLTLVTADDIKYTLYTRESEDKPVQLSTGDIEALQNSSFSNARPTKLLIHGWRNDGNTEWLQNLRKTYLKAGNYNVIVVDWGEGANREYLIAATLTEKVGRFISEFLKFLIMNAALPDDNIHLVGHSLGAHVSGYVGNMLSARLWRITGLDPASPDFEIPFMRDSANRLDVSDAQFVDVIHSCAGTAGFVRTLGHVDFYPNGGTFRQPGCPVLETHSCSHSRSHEFMEESIRNPNGFPASECTNLKAVALKICSSSKENPVVYMGENVSRSVRGIYYLETNDESPFGRG